MSESKWKQIVGKKISEGAYVSPDTLRKDYARAMSETCFAPLERSGQEAALLLLKDMARTMGLDPAHIFRMKTKDKPLTVEQQRRALLEEITLARQRLSKTGPRKKARKVVNEEQLENELNHGWRFVSVLPSGKILIECEE